MTWTNTNKLLFSKDEGYIGCKTGQTINAGNCLSTVYKNQDGKFFYIIVLGSETKDARFKDTDYLVKKHILKTSP
jgi:D-alanyl-D-alanine carboxypeptidase